MRTAGTPGYTASVDYVVAQLRSFGYTVTTPVAEMSALPRAARLDGGDVDGGPSFAAGDDFHAMIYSGGGDVTAPSRAKSPAARVAASHLTSTASSVGRSRWSRRAVDASGARWW